MMPDNRPSTYLEEGVRVFRASSFGGCVKALVAARDGLGPVPFPQSLQTAMEISGGLEAEVLSQLGEPIRDEQLEVELEVEDHEAADHEPTIIRGHIDGICGDRVVEVKVLGQHYWDLHKAGKLHEAMPQYPWQLSIYMLALGMKGLWAIGHKVEGVLLEVELVEVDKPYFYWEDVAVRVAEIRRAIFEPCTGDQWPCPYPYIHVDPIEESDDGDLRLLVDAYQHAKEEEEKWAAAKADARTAVIAQLGDRTRVGIGPYRVAHSQFSRRTLDTKALEASGFDLTPYYRESQANQLRITRRGD